MAWFKAASHAAFDLSTSGVSSVRWDELPFTVRDLDLNLTRPGGYGFPPLQEAIARKCGVSGDCVVTTIGTSMANHLVMAALLEPGDEVIVEHPTYELLVDTARYLGAEIQRFRRPAPNFGVAVEELERVVTTRTRLIVLTNLHNPGSALVDEATLMEIGRLADRIGARVLVDEAYLDAASGAHAPRSSFHLGPQFVATSSLTKAYGLSGLRCGWVLAEPDLAGAIWRLADLYYAMPPHITEIISVAALTHLRTFRARTRGILEPNARALNAFLASRDDLEATSYQGGTTSFPRLLRGDANRLCDILYVCYDTSVVPGRFFGLPEHFRIGIGGDTTVVHDGLERLAQALDELAHPTITLPRLPA
jgi:aspartate/methionine/tyrosine aminotransferase